MYYFPIASTYNFLPSSSHSDSSLLRPALDFYFLSTYQKATAAKLITLRRAELYGARSQNLISVFVSMPHGQV